MNRTMKHSDSFSLILATCDDYSSCWPPFFHFLDKYWPSFSAPIILSSSVPFSCENHWVQHVKKHDSWSTRLIYAIQKCRSEIILLCLDDFFLNGPVNCAFFNHALSVISKDPKVACINLHDTPSECEVSFPGGAYDAYFVQKGNVEYKITTQISLWKKNYLLKILHRGETPWQFELDGTRRSWHYKEKILYRRDEFVTAISYPVGGVIWRGAVSPTEECLASIEEYRKDTGLCFNWNTLPSRHSLRRPIVLKILRRVYLAFYRRCARYLTWIPYWA